MQSKTVMDDVLRQGSFRATKNFFHSFRSENGLETEKLQTVIAPTQHQHFRIKRTDRLTANARETKPRTLK